VGEITSTLTPDNMRSSRLLFLAAGLVVLVAPATQAQGDLKKYNPPRPRLPPSTDTNSAGVYYSFALAALQRDNAGEAAAGFHWASRLNPAWGEPLYGKLIALLLMKHKAARGLHVRAR
jgi:hypothetical protein